VVVYEGPTKCVMSLIYWKSLNSLTLYNSSDMLTSFDGHSFCPHSIFPAFLVQLGRKTIEVEFEVVDAPLDYNMLLGHNWNYAMVFVVSSVYYTPCFPHEGNIMTINQLSFAYTSPNASFLPSIPVIDNSQPKTKNIIFRMYSSLMGTFKFKTPIHHIMSSRHVLTGRSIPFRTSYSSDLWTLPFPNSSYEGQLHIGMAMPLSIAEISYQVVLDSSVNPNLVNSPMDEEDPVLRPVWTTSLSCSHDFFDESFPSDEAIIEAMNGSEKPWDDMHHRSYFLRELERIEKDDFRSPLSEIVSHVVVPLDTHNIYAEGNMESISPTVMINISRTPDKIENVNIGADCVPK
jgi:hypothetical protein